MKFFSINVQFPYLTIYFKLHCQTKMTYSRERISLQKHLNEKKLK